MSVARHTMYNFAGAVVPVAVSLLTVPIYLSVVGLDRYGVLAICWLLLGYFNLFDLGLGRATAQRLATLVDADPATRSTVFWIALILSAGLAVVATLLFLPAAHFGLKLMNFQSATVRAELDAALPWLTASLPVGILNGVLLGALEGRRKFLITNIAGSATTVLMAIAPLTVALLYGPDLWHLLAAALAVRLLNAAILAFACRRAVPVEGLGSPQPGQIKQLLKYGGWTSVSNTISPLLSVWDRFVIGAMLSSAAVAIYVIPFNFVSQLTMVPVALASALFPRLAAASEDEARALAAESIQLLAFVLTPITILALIVTGPFLYIWLGSTTGTAAAPTAYILLFGFWANSFARLPAAALQARGRPDLHAKVQIVELVPYLILLYLSLRWFGLEGAACAWAVRSTIDAVLLLALSSTPLRALAPLLVHFAVLLAGVVVAVAFPLWSIPKAVLLLLLFIGISIFALTRQPERIALLLARLPFMGGKRRFPGFGER